MQPKIQRKGGKFLNWLKTSVWAFPVVVIVVLLFLTTFKISGSSVGSYYPRLYGTQTKDPNLLYGKPQAIRSDEWLVNTQLTISQSSLGFPRINTNMAGGQDLSLDTDMPTSDWPTIFRPHLWAFLVLPVEFAFAFRWWVVLATLIISGYFFILRVWPRNKWPAIIISTAFGLSPFLLWWYQSGAFLVLAYGFMMAILIMRMLDGEPIRLIKNQKWSKYIYVFALIFVGACFGLIFYPPFQIPIAIVLVFFTIGNLLNKRLNDGESIKVLLRRLELIAIAGVALGLIGLAFYETHKTPIHALNSSVYPGHRRVSSGDLKLLHVFNSFVLPAEQSDFRSSHFIGNQSESSNFIMVMPFLLLPGFALMAREWLKNRKIDWVFLSIQGVSLLFLLRAFTHHGNLLGHLLLLDRVPNNRLVIGMGFVGILQLVYMLKKIHEAKINRSSRWTMALAYGALCFAILMAISIYIVHHYPLFLNNYWILGAFSAVFAGIVTAMLADLPVLAGLLLLGFTLLSGYRIMPLYHGLGELTHGKLVGNMQRISAPSDTWVTVGGDAGVYENFGLLAGRGSLSGTQIYPNLKLWEQIGGIKYQSIYNREGHAFFVDDPAQIDPITLLQGDAFLVKFQCSDFVTKNAQFALSVHPLTQPCVKLADTVKYPNATFYLYKIQK